MIDVNCYNCKSNKKKLILKQTGKDTYLELIHKNKGSLFNKWFSCLDCGFIYRSPVLTEPEIKKMYDLYDTLVMKPDADSYFDRIFNLPKKISENYQKCVWFKKNALKNLPSFNKISFIEVGSGSGLFMATAKKYLNIEKIYGVEPNTKMRKLAEKKVGTKVFKKLSEVREKFDFIFVLKVLEHIKDPRKFLKEIKKISKKKTTFFFEVPDVVDFINLKDDNSRFWIPHIYYFNRKTLFSILNEFNMKVITSRTIISNNKRSFFQLLVKNI